MSQIKHLMDTVANELGIKDPNDPRVRAECEQFLASDKVCLLAGTQEAYQREHPVCPKCGAELEHFSGLEFIPAYLYCPQCNDRAFDLEGNYLARIV